MNHTRLESMFQKQVSHMHAHHTRHTHASDVHPHDTMYAHVYTYTHYGLRAILQNFVMIEYIFQILQINLFGLGKVLTSLDPQKYGYQNPPLLYLM